MKKNRNIFSKVNFLVVFLLFSSVVFALIIYSVVIVRDLRQKETANMAVFAKAMRFLQDENQGDVRMLELVQEIITTNDNIPIIVTNHQGEPIKEFIKNIPDKIKDNSKALKVRLEEMKEGYPPFELQISEGNIQYLYFDNSDLMNSLRYYPALLGFFILLYLLFAYWFFKIVKKTDEGYLWAGLAKETAHQIGTPLSSMIGWIEILRMEHENSVGVQEIEKDIHRLTTISERFSKVGSIPELNDFNLNETLQQNYDYLKTRISKKVEFNIILPSKEVLIPHNRILMSWVIENLIKNAVDAMKGDGKLELKLYQKNKKITIDIQDTGCGMSAKQVRNVFNPGYSTKKRGWGLGLSLSKRVIKDYHKGDIKVAHTEIGKGSIFRIEIA
ncbi:HAMP domain-containing histidine kinase [Riemerella anatipestifer]|uniref:sensor histidine kinase n=1 Tax=Riemerella anatipestifer TaxID=34085 RepID=UPI001E4633C0|nr:HAMP domain-containing sensor histidine kinase [Riemerella anatipestifer]MCD5967911.1 HAMP domain-containing histidine kinase [Riemerella anatipestifer]MCU7540566.1 HAMP domain-containing histidine kinase [Riemerella anatipestifer]MCU7570319.1 HAMP domain-containing histidine kinase [Riemerella anatipestifer]MCU7598542.1 HAMP domain-containing histidine kinase [Riemerella anatipestifer]MCW0495152.1 HAMP domain-containing histidine kinase [Riemerella anatipestifer]